MLPEGNWLGCLAERHKLQSHRTSVCPAAHAGSCFLSAITCAHAQAGVPCAQAWRHAHLCAAAARRAAAAAAGWLRRRSWCGRWEGLAGASMLFAWAVLGRSPFAGRTAGNFASTSSYLPPSPSTRADPTRIDLIQDYAGWDFVQVDAALRGSDLHAVGVAVKPLIATGGSSTSAGGSVDAAAFEALMRRGKSKRQRQQKP